MKDIHDRSTHDFATIDSTFQMFGRSHRPYSPLLGLSDAENRRIERYLREKPYLAEALRRRHRSRK